MSPSTHSMNRRNFLRLAALAPLAAAAPAMAFAPIKRMGGAFIKPTLNAFSFLEQLNENMKDASKGIDLFGVVDFCAQHNIEAVDLTGYFFPGYPKAPADSYINHMKRYTHDSGIVISGTGVRNDFVPADKVVRAAGVQLTKDWIEIAARLGAPVIRVFAGPQGANQPWQEVPTGPNAPTWKPGWRTTCAPAQSMARSSASSWPCRTTAISSALAPSTSACSSGSITPGAEPWWTRANTSPTTLMPTSR